MSHIVLNDEVFLEFEAHRFLDLYGIDSVEQNFILDQLYAQMLELGEVQK